MAEWQRQAHGILWVGHVREVTKGQKAVGSRRSELEASPWFRCYVTLEKLNISERHFPSL